MTRPPNRPRNIPVGDIPRPGVHVPGRTGTGRQPSPSDSLRSISFRLEPRDYALAHLLHDHRTLTTAHITATLFTSTRTCRNRLAALRALGFIDSFIPVRPGGRLPLHWLPGSLSARYVALATGAKPPTAKALREQQDRIVAATAHLAHTDATNQVFIDLIAAARTTSGTRLTRWWPAATIASATGRRVHPDGHGVWRQNNVQVAWFLEMDLGTEFSGGYGPLRSPEPRVSAAQRLMSGRYRAPRVWCKHSAGVSSRQACDSRSATVQALPACGRFHGRAWGRCGCWCRDRHPDRPPCGCWTAAYGRFGCWAAPLGKTFWGLPGGGGNHV